MKEKEHRTNSSRSSTRSNRVPFLNVLSDDVRNHFIATSAEYAGTTLFLFFAFSGTQVALLAAPSSSTNEVGMPSNPSQLMFIALSFGFSLAVNASVFFRISGGLFNPARSFGPSVISHQFHTYHWIYWIGPILDSLLASGFYLFIKMLEYETPTQVKITQSPKASISTPTSIPAIPTSPSHQKITLIRELL